MLIYNELSKKILEAYFNVFKHLTTGFYLKITGMSVGYLLNFGESRDYKRIINK